MNEITECKKCHKKAVVQDVMFNTFEGEYRVCLNCGWYETQEYLTDEEVLENYREEFEDEYEEMQNKQQIEEENK